MDLLPEFLGILEKQTKIADQLSDIATNKQSLSEKNIVNTGNFAESGDTPSKLTANERKRVEEASSIFIKKLLTEPHKIESSKESTPNNYKVNNITNLIPKTVSKLEKPKEIDDARLTSNSRSRYQDISTIFISKFFEFQKKNTKDTKERTLIGKFNNIKDKRSSYINSMLSKKPNESRNDLIGWVFILDKLKSLIGLAAGFFVGVLPGLIKGTFTQINRLFQTTKLGKFASSFMQTIKDSKVLKMVTEPYGYLKNTNLFKNTANAISNIGKLPVVRHIVGGVKSGYKVGRHIPTVIGNTISAVAKSGSIIAKSLRASPIVSKIGKVAAKPLAVLGLALDAGTSVSKLSSAKGREDLRKTSENLNFQKRGKFLSTVGKVLFNPIETITSMGIAAKDLFDSNKSARESENSLKTAQERHLQKMKNKIPTQVMKKLTTLPVTTYSKILPTYSLGIKNTPSEDKNSKFKVSDIPKVSPILNIQKPLEPSYMFPKEQSKESMSRLESINTQANQYLQAIVNNTALMVKNFTGNNGSSGAGTIMINKSNLPETPSKTMAQISNNRSGYSSSPYALA